MQRPRERIDPTAVVSTYNVGYTMCLQKIGPLRLKWHNFTNSQHYWHFFVQFSSDMVKFLNGLEQALAVWFS